MSAAEHVGFLNRDANKPIDDGYCNPMKKSGPISMDHVLMALSETEERVTRIRSVFNFFDAANLGYLDNPEIEAGYMDDKELEMYRIFQAIDGLAVRRREGVGYIAEALGCWDLVSSMLKFKHLLKEETDGL
ncbi:PREDICTED: calcium-binding mitochondrial carrier [Prunus dulcis]|uniref:PREDICTED: calcium-binding mitochondrial carrier n=1 Tax=Prunus dulcis TaxID=3755 RepID=A0A5E4EQZ3_PRUDU|nr:PREDICTED: calcium-binding mitochondrial carrier [Prunus dulcis]